MIQREPGSPEDAVVQWLDGRAETFRAAFFAFVSPLVNHPYFAIAVLVVVVYLAVARKGKRKR